MSFLKSLKKKMHKGVQRRLIRQLVFVRMVDFVDESAWKLIWKKIKHLSDIELFGTPEGTIVMLVESYWGLRIGGNNADSDVFRRINEARQAVNFPLGTVQAGLSLTDYVIYRVRLEAPEHHGEQDIDDASLQKSIDLASEETQKWFKET